ncbi:MAG: ABC transporter permease [Vicinamibacterales bacterium]
MARPETPGGRRPAGPDDPVDHDARLREEIAFHIDQQAERLVRQGVPPDRARREARLRFGGVEGVREATRDEQRAAWLFDFGRDLRFGARVLRRSPVFAVLAVLTLGLGIGASTALFSVVDGVLLRGLPYPDAGRLVRLYQVNDDGTTGGPPRQSSRVSEPNVLDWRRLTHGFSGIAEMAQWGDMPIAGGEQPVMARRTVVSREFFDVMGVAPADGRVFRPEELQEGAAPTAIVSHAFRNRAFAGGPVVGKTIRIGQTAYTVVGEMPPGFDYPGETGVWTPREIQALGQQSRTAHNFQAVARVADGVSVRQAQAELSAVSRQMREEYGSTTWMVDAAAIPLLEQLTATARPALNLLFGAAIVLFLIACTNVTNLLLARAAARRHEQALQLAVGASRWRLVRQVVAETLVLTAAGGLVGVLVAAGAVRALLSLDPGSVPRLADVALNWPAVGFAIGASLAAALGIGLVAALRGRDADLRAVLADAQRSSASSPSRERARQVLVVAQVALTLVLLAGTALLGRSFLSLLGVEPGYRTAGATVLDLVRPRGTGAEEMQRQWQFQTALMDRLAAMPGVEGVGLASGFPLGGADYSTGRYYEMTRVDEFQSYADIARLGDRALDRAGQAGFRVVGGDYFRVMGIPVLEGRTFEAGDLPDAPHVAVVSEAFARDRWPDRDPIGRFIQFGNMDGDPRGFRVVGVVGDVRELSPETPPGPLFYVDYRQRPGHASGFSIVVAGPESARQPQVMQRIVRDLDAGLPVTIHSIEDAFDAALSGRRFNLLLIMVFGLAALALATLGTYGLITYLVAQRTREIGIRMALGAGTASVMRLILGAGLRLAAVGTVIGVAASLGLSRLLDGLLFAVSATDPAAYAIVIVATIGAVLAASLVPALRATRIPPTESLR